MKRSRPSLIGVAAVVAVLAVSGCGPTPEPEPEPQPEPSPEESTEHFLCYDAFEPPPPGTNRMASLKDQFDEEYEPFNGFPRFFCNAVEKVPAKEEPETLPDEPPALRHPDHHLTGYGWQDPQEDEELMPAWRVKVTNQFALLPSELTLADERWLMVPSGKNGSEIPKDLDHFKCYPVIDGPSVLEPFHLNDQFPGRYDFIEVGPARAFCNPTAKRLPHNVEIQNPKAHLTCYDVGYPYREVITVENQFNGTTLQLGDLRWLCAPSAKSSPQSLPPPEQESSPLPEDDSPGNGKQ